MLAPSVVLLSRPHIRTMPSQNPPLPLTLVSHAQLPIFSHGVSCRFYAATPLTLYRTLELSSAASSAAAATIEAEEGACIASLPTAPHLATLLTSCRLPGCPHTHGLSFHFSLCIALRSICAPSTLMLHVFDNDLLALALPTHARLTLRADMHPFAFFNNIFAVH
jgi:hypothetical protein